jgi:hypothetical protein
MKRPDAGSHLHLEVRLLAEPALWCWEIRDRRSGQVIESSWATNWMAYESRAEAVAAGRERLRWHAASAASPRPPARTAPAGERAS